MGLPCALTPRDFSLGGVLEIIFRFHAASPASHRPGLSPTRGSGDGAAADTIGVTGFGIVDGGFGGGGSGGPPRPPRPAPAGAFPVSAAAGAAAGCAAGALAGAFAGAAASCGAAGAAAGGVFGAVFGGAAVFDPPPHAASAHASAAATNAPPINCLMISPPPASVSSDRSRCSDRHRRRLKT